MDDQLARCLIAEKEGWGFVVKERNEVTIQEGIRNLLEHQPKNISSEHINGADELCQQLITRIEVID